MCFSKSLLNKLYVLNLNVYVNMDIEKCVLLCSVVLAAAARVNIDVRDISSHITYHWLYSAKMIEATAATKTFNKFARLLAWTRALKVSLFIAWLSVAHRECFPSPHPLLLLSPSPFLCVALLYSGHCWSHPLGLLSGSTLGLFVELGRVESSAAAAVKINWLGNWKQVWEL